MFGLRYNVETTYGRFGKAGVWENGSNGTNEQRVKASKIGGSKFVTCRPPTCDSQVKAFFLLMFHLVFCLSIFLTINFFFLVDGGKILNAKSKWELGLDLVLLGLVLVFFF